MMSIKLLLNDDTSRTTAMSYPDSQYQHHSGPPNNDPRIDARPHLQSNEMVGAPATFTAVTETSTATTTAPEAARDERPNRQTSPRDEFCRALAVSGLEQLEAPEPVEREAATLLPTFLPDAPLCPKDIEFNRKDLFTQHLRRMHGPFNRALTKGNNDQKQSEWESYIKGMQQNCLVTRRRPPQQSSCPKPGCVNTFDGPTAWDEWATHVGRHMENGEGDDLGVNDWLQCYALEEGIIEKDGKGYKLRKSQLQEGEP
ncbi:hypothetical protein ISF_09694 [Cordyceps fumosorosea ARSEF 2679]|uniref:C2H2 finger domain-containing protein n=1 Tax=Cordyceps fumosorosea (strain ARSEF 2679) TaxID=1081104 RepID=A0A162JDG9_CORFA|nr:hypothetical protein ISF_09694 [Cordyceps fumosorosea ARSEF 2679]OAA42778.1 hypothetical protein ISF_09694 [Cordyceps fumosorosea ARSEF 2679]